MSRRPRSAVVVTPGDPAGELPAGDEVLDEPDRGDLEDLADPRYADWTWHIYRVRSLEEMARLKTKIQRPWALTVQGPLDLAQLRQAVGGGVFEAWGYITGERGTRERHTFEMEGPPREYTPPAATPVAVTAPAPVSQATPNETNPILVLLQQQQKLLEQILLRPAAAAATAPQGFTFREMLSLAGMLRGNGGGGVDVKELIGLFKQGIEVGGTASGGDPKSTLEVILEKAMPALERIGVALAARRPVVARAAAPPPRPRPESHATVVEEPTSPFPPDAGAPAAPATAAADPELTDEQRQAALRWNAAVDALSRAVEASDDPDDFADTLDHLLLPAEIDLMLAGGVDAVMEQLRTAGDRFPILMTPAAHGFVARVLTSLENPPEITEPAL